MKRNRKTHDSRMKGSELKTKIRNNKKMRCKKTKKKTTFL
jgi:hypothetical protein